MQSADDAILVITYSKSDWAARFLQQRTSMVAVLYQTLCLHYEGVASQTTLKHELINNYMPALHMYHKFQFQLVPIVFQ